ncbi:MAG: fused MFS/spermidine synthase, partial [Nitriliruptoraceae bacterium]
MHRTFAAALVFFSSAAVLVLEILAARLLAPYVGVTLEVYTAIIGVILAGIAMGSWWGGRAADRIDPRTMIGPLLVTGGALALITIPLIDGLGAGLRGAGPATTVILTFAGFFAPAAVLTAVTPAVIKLRLSSLDETGSVVGRLSAIGTAGAIVGTFTTGFVLVAALPTRPVIRILAVTLIVLGVATGLWMRRGRALSAGSLVAVLAASAFSFAASHPCQHESAYYCAYIQQDPGRDAGYVLWLDTLRHSYVDVDDPTYLEFAYTSWFGDVIAAIAPDGQALDALHIGGGAMTMPRYLRAAHPGSTSTVLELDPLLVELATDRLGFEPGDDIEVLTGDARLGIEQVERGAYDLVIGDAFGGVAVPWHLATREFTTALHDRMRPDGVYIINVLDHGPRDFLKAEVATLAEIFTHVAVISWPGWSSGDAGSAGGNHVIIASHAPLPVDDIQAANRRRAHIDEIVYGDDLKHYIGDANVLTDDHAP